LSSLKPHLHVYGNLGLFVSPLYRPSDTKIQSTLHDITQVAYCIITAKVSPAHAMYRYGTYQAVDDWVSQAAI